MKDCPFCKTQLSTYYSYNVCKKMSTHDRFHFASTQDGSCINFEIDNKFFELKNDNMRCYSNYARSVLLIEFPVPDNFQIKSEEQIIDKLNAYLLFK